MDSVCIRDVAKGMAANETGTIGPIKAFVVNFEACTDFPRKFYYHGCCRPSSNGRPCSKTVEGIFACQHRSVEDGSWREMYRFDIFLADGSIGTDCPPIRATIFQPAQDLLGISAPDFAKKPDFEQYCIVHGATTRMHQVEVFIRLKEHAGTTQCTIQSLCLLGDQDCQILHSHGPTSSTPRRSTSRSTGKDPSTIFHTPKASFKGSPSATGSSTGGKFASVKARLLDLIDTLDDTHLN